MTQNVIKQKHNLPYRYPISALFFQGKNRKEQARVGILIIFCSSIYIISFVVVLVSDIYPFNQSRCSREFIENYWSCTTLSALFVSYFICFTVLFYSFAKFTLTTSGWTRRFAFAVWRRDAAKSLKGFFVLFLSPYLVVIGPTMRFIYEGATPLAPKAIKLADNDVGLIVALVAPILVLLCFGAALKFYIAMSCIGLPSRRRDERLASTETTMKSRKQKEPSHV